MIQTLSLVALGGAIGAALRYLANVSALRLLGPGFPYATLLVNVAGSFLIGLLFVMLMDKGGGRLGPFVLTGILGGFTTFSAFSLDTLVLVEKGQGAMAAVYVAASVGLSLTAIVAGLALGRGIWA